jgi:hypothetical protein
VSREGGDEVERIRETLTADWTLPQGVSTRPLLSLVRIHCGLRMVYGFVHVLRRGVRRRLTCGTAVCLAWFE